MSSVKQKPSQYKNGLSVAITVSSATAASMKRQAMNSQRGSQHPFATTTVKASSALNPTSAAIRSVHRPSDPLSMSIKRKHFPNTEICSLDSRHAILALDDELEICAKKPEETMKLGQPLDTSGSDRRVFAERGKVL